MSKSSNKLNNSPRVALIYDRINKWGGAERVLLNLHKIFPNAPLYTLVHNPSTSKWAKDIKVISSFFNQLKYLRNHHQFLAPVSSLGFESFSFDNFDLVISVTSESAKSIITKPHALHICYCLTPTRYLWSASKQYRGSPGLGIFSPLVKLALHLSKKKLQKKDFIHGQRPDHYLAISKEVQTRIKKYYHRNSQIIYPTINYDFWSKKTTKNSSQPYYLLVSRLVPYKKVDLVIDAFSKLPNQNLKIIGTGSEIKKLKRLASSNIIFLGHVSDQKLHQLYSNAQALIFPQNEDFGLTPLEAQATGTPVLAYHKGGACETVIKGKTGLFFDNQTPRDIIKTIKKFQQQKNNITPQACRENARKFDNENFNKLFFDTVNKLWQKHQKN